MPWTDLIFCTNQNVISNYGVDVSVFKTCHHNIIPGKKDIRVTLDYNKNSSLEQDLILIAVSIINWNRACENNFVDEKVELMKL